MGSDGFTFLTNGLESLVLLDNYIMNKSFNANVAVLAIFCAFISGDTQAGTELDAVNVQVEQKAQELDEKYGVLLTGQERNELKIALVAKKVAAENADASVQIIEEATDAAIVIYEVTDPTDQRKLLIEIEASELRSGGSGNKPPCCG